MTVFPSAVDSDSELPRIDDNLTEVGGQAINALRDAIFAIEATLGINPHGSAGSVANRLDKSLDANGDIKASALTSIGLASLPITDSQVASNAAIAETKLALDFTTADLHTLIVANSGLINSLNSFATTTNSDLLVHIQGGALLADASTSARHVASHVDLNAVPSDSRDVSFVWDGLKDKDGVLRSATNVGAALDQINDALTTHENLTADAHPASAITVDTSSFIEIPQDADTVQKALDAIDDAETISIGEHRAVMHSNGVPKSARSSLIGIDGYSQNIVPSTSAKAFLVQPPATMPVDSNISGDDLIQFVPDNAGFVFDSKFTLVRPGDIVTINYGNGTEARFPVESIRFVPNSEWFVRINGVNLVNQTDGYALARIDRPLFDDKTQGVLAVAAANNDIDGSIISSLIVGNPRGASAVGIGFDANKLDSDHYKLYLQFYPTGNPADKVINLPAIDVTGNAGATPGQYTIDTVVQSTNDGLRAAGFNYRFIAFNHKGEFGIMLADTVNNVSFAIISGEVSGTTLDEGIFTDNVIGDATDGQDALGLGSNKANVAGPSFVSTFPSQEAATDFPVKVIVPLKNRNYIVNGVRRDTFADTPFATTDGYWVATLTARTPVGATTVEVSYTVDACLDTTEIKPGKTIVVQPELDFDEPGYNDVDYGRFIIKSVSFTAPCGDDLATTVITVVNGLHASGTPTGFSTNPEIPVRLYFSEDSVSFNDANVVDASPSGITYNRYHEIYADEFGKTFSHERARMPKQTETGELLATTARWTVKNVSPKLRGFRDDSSSELNKYVRFYILSYDSASGEFDGYIGRRIPSTANVDDTGIRVSGRKNVPVRFYDNTNVDFIELEFFDETASPGINIMSTNAPRYVDIEIFSSLELDEEFFLIASCELDDKRVDYVQDRRQFGNVSEKNFSDSAIDFITAGDRYLHENGVVRGLDLDSIDSSDTSILQFNGGVALVNGRIVMVNNASVRIPEIRETGATLPATVTWAICVNEVGQLVPIILTATKDQFFATTGSGSFYVPSVTFNELVTKRKDLTIIQTVVATIASITLSTTDARRFVKDTGFSREFILVSDDEQLPGCFDNLNALGAWIKNSSNSRHVVKVRGGDIAVGTGTAFSNFNSKEVIFDGTDLARSSSSTATFLFDNSTTLTIPANVTFRNIDFSFGSSSTITFGSNNVLEDCSITATTDFTVVFGSASKLVRSTLTATSGNFTFSGGNEIIQSTINYTTSATTPSIAGLTKIDRSTISFGDLNDTTGLSVGGLTTIDNSIFDSGTAHRCLHLTGGGVAIRNCAFTYGPTGLSYTALHKLNIVSATNTEVACIFGNGSLDNIMISDCVFGLDSGFAGTERPPYVGFVLNRGNILENLQVIRNQFNDNSGTGLMSSITVLNRQSGSGSGPIVSNSRIVDNIGNQEQSIVLTSVLDGSFHVVTPGLHCVNTTISGNRCGNIGYIISSDDLYGNSSRGRSGEVSLTIAENQARIIGNISDSGNFVYADGYDYGAAGAIDHDTGNVVIRHNSCNWILTSAVSSNYGVEKAGTVLIDGNRLDGYNGAYLTTHGATVLGVPLDISIVVGGGAPGSGAECRVVNNTTNFGYLSGTEFSYGLGNIRTDVSSIISGNTFRGIINDSAVALMMNLHGQQNIITSNRFFRSSSEILAYVFVGSTTIEGVISDNFFDSPVNSGLDTLLVNLAGNPNFVMDRNKNQTFIAPINGSSGQFGTSTGAGAFYDTTDGAVSQLMKVSVRRAALSTSSIVRVTYTGTGAVLNAAWLIDCDSMLPAGAKILNFGATIQSDAAADTVGTAVLRLTDGIGGVETLNTTVDLTAGGGYIANTPVATTINLFTPDTKHIVGTNTQAQIIVSFDHASTANIDISSVFFTYRF